MATVFYSFIPKAYDNKWFNETINTFPISWQQRILRYKQPQDRMLRLYGRLLLIKMLDHFKLNTLQLADLQYSPHNKPFFNASFDFSIAHSGSLVVCAATLDGKVGIDVEKIDLIEYSLLKEHFSLTEWQKIHAATNPLTLFYIFWTRKEAILKAIGNGVFNNFASIDITSSHVIYNETAFNLFSLKISGEYVAHLANNKEMDEIEIKEVFL